MLDHPTSNGGPPIVPEGVRMDYAPWHVRDFLQGVKGLKMDEVGIYAILLALMYDKMGELRDNDRWVAYEVGVDIRLYRRAKAALISQGKIFSDGEFLRNRRVEQEITAFCAKIKNYRRGAERRSEAQRKSADKVAEQCNELHARVQQKSGNLAPSYRVATAQPSLSCNAPEPQLLLSDNEKPNEIKCSAATILQGEAENHRHSESESKSPKESPNGLLSSGDDFTSPPLEALRAFESWNALALECKLAQAAKLTPQRQKSIRARLREYGADGWARVLDAVRASPFLRGTNERGWRCDLDWLIGPTNFGKVYDGRYATSATQPAQARPPGAGQHWQDEERARRAAFAEALRRTPT